MGANRVGADGAGAEGEPELVSGGVESEPEPDPPADGPIGDGDGDESGTDAGGVKPVVDGAGGGGVDGTGTGDTPGASGSDGAEGADAVKGGTLTPVTSTGTGVTGAEPLEGWPLKVTGGGIGRLCQVPPLCVGRWRRLIGVEALPPFALVVSA